jgi:integrase
MAVKRDLTDKGLQALKPAPPGKRYFEWDAVVDGFAARVDDADPPNIAFYFVKRFPGQKSPSPRKIADYRRGEGKDERAGTLRSARQKAREWLDGIQRGIDPKQTAEAARRAAEAARREAERQAKNTFRLAFEDYVEERRADKDDDGRTKMRSLDVMAGVIRKHVYPAWENRPFTEITRNDANDLLKPISKATPTHARRIRSYLGTFGLWAENDGRIKESPFLKLKHLGTENKRNRHLTKDEIRVIWRASAHVGAFGYAVRMMLVTGQRRTEVGGMLWREIDEAKRLWLLPSARTKSKRDHIVPLSGLAMSILADCSRVGPHVFTSRPPRKSAREFDTKATTAPLSGWSQGKSRLDKLALTELRDLTGDDEAKLPEWHLHDLRRTCVTNLAALRVERIVVSKVMNHAEGGVTTIYDQHAYTDEKRAALDRWARRLIEIVDGIEPSNVVSFPARG